MRKAVFRKLVRCPRCEGWCTEPGMKLLKGAGVLVSNNDPCSECWGLGRVWVTITKEEFLAAVEQLS